MMKAYAMVALGLAASLAVAGGAVADGGFQQHYDDCVDRFATANEPASVTLECNAAGGRLGACRVVEDSAPGRGFDKAAICVAAFLPVAGRSGAIRVPVRFAG